MPGVEDGVAKLSVNVNKVATVRNSRGGNVPSLIEAVQVCIDAGAPGITVHPRADARHITATDVRDIARHLRPLGGRVEFNIEGDPRPDFLALVHEVAPSQCTLVPVRPGEVTIIFQPLAGVAFRSAKVMSPSAFFGTPSTIAQ